MAGKNDFLRINVNPDLFFFAKSLPRFWDVDRLDFFWGIGGRFLRLGFYLLGPCVIGCLFNWFKGRFRKRFWLKGDDGRRCVFLSSYLC